MTSADYAEYEKEFQKSNNKKLIPKSALKNSAKIKIKSVKPAFKAEDCVVAACALNNLVSGNDAQFLKENKEILNENIKKHIQVENMVRELSGYITINCSCDTKLKIPPVYKNQIIICPHCKKKHPVITIEE